MPVPAHISKPVADASLPVRPTLAAQRPADPPHDRPSDQDLDQFALRVATILAKPGAIDAFCDRIEDLLAKADAAR